MKTGHSEEIFGKLGGASEKSIDWQITLTFPEKQVFTAVYGQIFGDFVFKKVIFVPRVATLIQILHQSFFPLFFCLFLNFFLAKVENGHLSI